MDGQFNAPSAMKAIGNNVAKVAISSNIELEAVKKTDSCTSVADRWDEQNRIDLMFSPIKKSRTYLELHSDTCFKWEGMFL